MCAYAKSKFAKFCSVRVEQVEDMGPTARSTPAGVVQATGGGHGVLRARDPPRQTLGEYKWAACVCVNPLPTTLACPPLREDESSCARTDRTLEHAPNAAKTATTMTAPGLTST